MSHRSEAQLAEARAPAVRQTELAAVRMEQTGSGAFLPHFTGDSDTSLDPAHGIPNRVGGAAGPQPAEPQSDITVGRDAHQLDLLCSETFWGICGTHFEDPTPLVADAS